jgi:chromosome segregation ATPase
LKQALKEEKETSEKKDKAMAELRGQIDTLNAQMADKDRKYEKLLQEKTNLEDSLLRDNKKKKDDGSDLKRSISGNDYKP